jgi:hypothetical protein
MREFAREGVKLVILSGDNRGPDRHNRRPPLSLRDLALTRLRRRVMSGSSLSVISNALRLRHAAIE